MFAPGSGGIRNIFSPFIRECFEHLRVRKSFPEGGVKPGDDCFPGKDSPQNKRDPRDSRPTKPRKLKEL